MLIREMNREKCLRILAGTRLARLACAFENQSYVVPIYFAYHQPSDGEDCIYGFTTPGQKVEWMRANPLVCVEVDEITAYDQWVSVVAFGRYEELPDAPGRNDELLFAHQLLQQEAMWWEPAATARTARVHRDPSEPFVPVYYKIRLNQITGHEATRDPRDTCSCSVTATPARRPGWLLRAVARVFGGKSTNAVSVSFAEGDAAGATEALRQARRRPEQV